MMITPKYCQVERTHFTLFGLRQGHFIKSTPHSPINLFSCLLYQSVSKQRDFDRINCLVSFGPLSPIPSLHLDLHHTPLFSLPSMSSGLIVIYANMRPFLLQQTLMPRGNISSHSFKFQNILPIALSSLLFSPLPLCWCSAVPALV